MDEWVRLDTHTPTHLKGFPAGDVLRYSTVRVYCTVLIKAPSTPPEDPFWLYYHPQANY